MQKAVFFFLYCQIHKYATKDCDYRLSQRNFVTDHLKFFVEGKFMSNSSFSLVLVFAACELTLSTCLLYILVYASYAINKRKSMFYDYIE